MRRCWSAVNKIHTRFLALTISSSSGCVGATRWHDLRGCGPLLRCVGLHGVDREVPPASTALIRGLQAPLTPSVPTSTLTVLISTVRLRTAMAPRAGRAFTQVSKALWRRRAALPHPEWLLRDHDRHDTACMHALKSDADAARTHARTHAHLYTMQPCGHTANTEFARTHHAPLGTLTRTRTHTCTRACASARARVYVCLQRCACMRTCVYAD